jgi:hypothetical protein
MSRKLCIVDNLAFVFTMILGGVIPTTPNSLLGVVITTVSMILAVGFDTWRFYLWRQACSSNLS